MRSYHAKYLTITCMGSSVMRDWEQRSTFQGNLQRHFACSRPSHISIPLPVRLRREGKQSHCPEWYIKDFVRQDKRCVHAEGANQSQDGADRVLKLYWNSAEDADEHLFSFRFIKSLKNSYRVSL